ncbi:hypothetical protein I926_05460 [Pasteurella multocida subsp. multocida OH4807]|nr:hypothetical protein I926_05460 [Pasteurella multocida subsp. multocida OH4807]
MIKIKLPTDCQNYSDIIASCCTKMTQNNAMYSKIMQNKHGLLRIYDCYIKLAKKNLLFKYKKYICNASTPIKLGASGINSLTGHDMHSLYKNYFVSARCGGYYDKIINHAKTPNIQCPFCGGIGEPNELDHFLPKANFAYYSISPYNLIPICKSCNQSYKKNFYPTDRNDQLIHPYLDDDCFFEEQWLFADCIIDNNDIESSTVKYYVFPPENWSEDKKGKVNFHFDMFDLDRRFSTRAASYLSELIAQITQAKNNTKLSETDCIEIILDSIINKPEYNKNHWRVVLYQAVKNNFTHIWTNI